jgi:exoribonuclease II
VTYALFDDAGKFFAGRVMSEADTALQVELDSGKRVKVKSANVMLRFTQPEPAALMARAHALAQEIDLDLAWEFAPPEDFGFADFAREYFDAPSSRPRRCCACSMRRTTFAGWAAACSARRRKKR